MNVVGCDIEYAVVPFVEFDATAAGQLIVETATVFDPMAEYDMNGSFLPHW